MDPIAGDALAGRFSRRRARVRSGPALLAALVLSGCSHANSASTAQASPGAASAGTRASSAPAADLAGTPGNTFEVTFTPATVVFERSEIPDVVGDVTEDGAYFALNGKNPKVAALNAGSVLFVKGLALRKILDVSRKGDVVVAHTEPAPLGAAIENGKITFNADVDWSKVASAKRPDPIAALLERTSSPAEANTLTAGGVTIDSAAHSLSGNYKGWEVSASADPSGSQVHLALNASRTIGAAVIKIAGTGTISNFNSSGSIEVVNGVINKLAYANKNVTAAVDFEWSVAKNDPGVLKLDRSDRVIKLPSLIETPIVIGGIPFELGITESVLIDPAITGGHEIASGKYHVTYSGSEGFSDSSGEVQNENGATADAALVAKSALSAIAPLGFVAAIAAPRIELATGPAAFKEELAKYTSAVPSTYTDIFKQALQDTAVGAGIVKAVDDFSNSGIAGYTEFILSIGYTYAGASDISGCQSTHMYVDIKAGADAQWMSTSASPSTQQRIQSREDVTPDIARCHVKDTNG